MIAKEYLLQVGIIDAKLKTIDANIARLRKEIYALEDISLSSSWSDGEPHGLKITDPTGDKAARLADRSSERLESLKKQLADYEYQQIITRSKLWEKRMEVIDTIGRIHDAKCYRLLIMRYIEGAKWELIAVDMDNTYQWVAGPLHSKALILLQEVLDET